MLDGVLQSFLGLSASRPGIPFFIEKFQFFRPPTSSNVRAEIIYPPQMGDSLHQNIAIAGDARLYLFNFVNICSFV